MITFYKIKSFSKHIKYCSSTIGSIFIYNNFSLEENENNKHKSKISTFINENYIENYVKNNIENKYEENSGIWQYLNEFEKIYLETNNKTEEKFCNEIISLLPKSCVYIDNLVSIEDVDQYTFYKNIPKLGFQKSIYKYRKFKLYGEKENEQIEKFDVIDKQGNRYSVKLIKEADFTDRVKNEIRTLFDLQYNNIKNINKINKILIERDDEKKIKNYYIFTKFYEEGTIDKYIKKYTGICINNGIKVDDNFYINIMKQLIDIIYALHNEGYSHRNLRLTNILVDNNGNLILKGFKYATKYEKSKNTCGSTTYWPPEIFQIRANSKLHYYNNNNIQDLIETYDNKKKDIYSLGILLTSFAYHIEHHNITKDIENNIKENKNETEKKIALDVLTKYLKQFEGKKGILNYYLYNLLCNIFCEESKRYDIDNVKNSMFYQYCSFKLENKNKINIYNNEIIYKLNISKDITYDNFIKNLDLSKYSEEYSFCNKSNYNFLNSKYRYVIDETLDMGGMSDQMIVRDKYDNKFFVKIIDKKYKKYPFLAQKEIGTMLYFQINKYENILNILNLMHDDKKYYIITKYYNNGNLRCYLKNLKKECEKNGINKGDDFYLNIIKQLIDYIYTLHKEGFAHRDIKPYNILVDNDEKLILADFGTITNKTYSHLKMGTKFYYSPEAYIEKNGYYTKKNDIFSMAVTICTIIFDIEEDKIFEDFYKNDKNIKDVKFEKIINDIVKKLNKKKCNLNSDEIKKKLINLLKNMLCEEDKRYDIDNVKEIFDKNIYNNFIETNK